MEVGGHFSWEGVPMVERMHVDQVGGKVDWNTLQDLASKDLPLVIEGMFSGQPCEEWTCQTIVDAFGAQTLTVRTSPEEVEGLGEVAHFRYERHTMEEVVQNWLEKVEKRERRYYLSGNDMMASPHLKSLLDASVQQPVPQEKIVELGLWMGLHKQHSQCHFDVAHNILHVIRGT